MKASDLLPTLLDLTEERLIKQKEDSGWRLSSRSEVFTPQKEFIKMETFFVGLANAAD